MGILAMVAVPTVELAHRRTQEVELRRALRELRTAIDRYKDASDRGELGPRVEQASGYPPSLDALVAAPVKCLRRVPDDPFTGQAAWGVRSSTDPAGVTVSDGRDVWDVYALSEGTGMDGTPYRTW